jgi:hypothetical protein
MKAMKEVLREQVKDFAVHRAPNCNCGHIVCVCSLRSRHAPGCKFMLAATGPIGIACEHNRDVCPICDPCTCA